MNRMGSLITACAAVLLVSGSNASACSCIPLELEDKFERADHVYIARVISRERESLNADTLRKRGHADLFSLDDEPAEGTHRGVPPGGRSFDLITLTFRVLEQFKGEMPQTLTRHLNGSVVNSCSAAPSETSVDMVIFEDEWGWDNRCAGTSRLTDWSEEELAKLRRLSGNP